MNSKSGRLSGPVVVAVCCLLFLACGVHFALIIVALMALLATRHGV